mmetsp:Transcript_30071/g.72471  ORF Transcript_30071/g.72471 Transcript_30071/m.72471 type:complete len:371 (+) Transcript_30071:2034-3146(+)
MHVIANNHLLAVLLFTHEVKLNLGILIVRRQVGALVHAVVATPLVVRLRISTPTIRPSLLIPTRVLVTLLGLLVGVAPPLRGSLARTAVERRPTLGVLAEEDFHALAVVHVVALTIDLDSRFACLQMLHAKAAGPHREGTQQTRCRRGRDHDGAERVPMRSLLGPHLVPDLASRFRGIVKMQPVAHCRVAARRPNRLVTLVHDKQRPQPAILEPAVLEEVVEDAGLPAEPLRHARVHHLALPESPRLWLLLPLFDPHEHVLLAYILLLPGALVPHRPRAIGAPFALDRGTEVGAPAPQAAELHQLPHLRGVVEHHKRSRHGPFAPEVIPHRVVRLQDRHQEALGVDGGETLAEHLLHPLVHPLQGLDHVG